jgi:nucleoside-diphosphate-sugar epimerase
MILAGPRGQRSPYPKGRGFGVTIAVTIPAGQVGSHVVRMLCQAGVRPRLLVRNPDRLDTGLRDLAELAVG